MNYAQPSSETIRETVSIATDTNPPQGHGTILLVEDDARLREATCRVLEATGYRVLQARNAAEAISVFREYKAIVRLLLTDVVLTGENGRDLANEVRGINPNLRILFTSGYPAVLMLATLLAISSRACVWARNPAHAA